MSTDPLKCQLKGSEIVVDDSLRISFRRTIRVPDNEHAFKLPPDLGAYPLKAVADYRNKLKPAMAAKGGVFFPMYQSEAMWIDFECSSYSRYMIKIYVGGVNAISGEPGMEDAGTKLRRQAQIAQLNGKASDFIPLQDYIVVPGQMWLDGIADYNGTVRQFVAMPFESGYSVESQITGKDAAGGIQFEVTRFASNISINPRNIQGYSYIWVKTLTGQSIKICVESSETIEMLTLWIQDHWGYPHGDQILMFRNATLEKGRTLADYGITHGMTIHLRLRLRGGGRGYCPQTQMAIAAGGKIEQGIVPDRLRDHWERKRITVFNVQILNSAVYNEVTGEAPPTKPIDVKTYKQHGLPFYRLYEEPSEISGDFSLVKSVAQIKGEMEEVVTPDTVEINNIAAQQPAGLANPNGPLREFRTLRDLVKEFEGLHVANF